MESKHGKTGSGYRVTDGVGTPLLAGGCSVSAVVRDAFKMWAMVWERLYLWCGKCVRRYGRAYINLGVTGNLFGDALPEVNSTLVAP